MPIASSPVIASHNSTEASYFNDAYPKMKGWSRRYSESGDLLKGGNRPTSYEAFYLHRE